MFTKNYKISTISSRILLQIHSQAWNCKPDFHSPWQVGKKIPIHPSSQAEALSLAIWYHFKEEEMVIQVQQAQDIFLEAIFFAFSWFLLFAFCLFVFVFFSRELVKMSVSLRKKKKDK